MALCLTWKYFSKEQLDQLEAALDPHQCKGLLRRYLGQADSSPWGKSADSCGTDPAPSSEVQQVDSSARTGQRTGPIRAEAGEDLDSDEFQRGLDQVVLDFTFYNYAFCKERRFCATKSSTFLSLAKQLFDQDMLEGDGQTSVEQSFREFKELLLTHSVERPPWSTGVFEVEETKAIVDYFTNSYYRHFKVYKGIFTREVHSVLQQAHPHCVEQAEPPLPLSSALYLPMFMAECISKDSFVAGGGGREGEERRGTKSASRQGSVA